MRELKCILMNLSDECEILGKPIYSLILSYEIMITHTKKETFIFVVTKRCYPCPSPILKLMPIRIFCNAEKEKKIALVPHALSMIFVCALLFENNGSAPVLYM